MSRKRTWLVLVGVAVVGIASFGAGAGEEREETVTLDQVPLEVKATILAEAAGGEIREIERETKDGKTVYEAEFVLDGREVEIKVAPDGTLLDRAVEGEDDDDEGVRAEDVPAAARAALRKLAGGARILKVEREREEGVEVYEAEWRDKGTKHEAAVTADGTLIEMEESVRLSDLPLAVRAAVAKHFPRNVRAEVAKKTIIVYEIEARVDGEEKELYVFPTGRVDEGAGQEDEGDEDGEDAARYDEDGPEEIMGGELIG